MRYAAAANLQICVSNQDVVTQIWKFAVTTCRIKNANGQISVDVERAGASRIQAMYDVLVAKKGLERAFGK